MVEYDEYRFKSKEKLKYVKKETSYCVGCKKKKNTKGVALETKIQKYGKKSQCVLIVILKNQIF